MILGFSFHNIYDVHLGCQKKLNLSILAMVVNLRSELKLLPAQALRMKIGSARPI